MNHLKPNYPNITADQQPTSIFHDRHEPHMQRFLAENGLPADATDAQIVPVMDQHLATTHVPSIQHPDFTRHVPPLSKS